MAKKYTTLQKLSMMYVMAWSISPPLQIDTQYRLIALGCIAIWFWQYLSNNKLNLQKIHNYAIYFACAVALIAFIEYGLSNILRPIATYLLVLAFILNYLHRFRWDDLNILIPFVLILLTIWNMKTVTTLHSDPTIARLLVRNDEETYKYLRMGVGGYGLLYPQVCIFPMMISWLIGALRNKRLYFAVGVIWITSYILFVFQSGYTIAIVTSVVSLIILFLYNRKSITMAMVITLSLIFLIVWLIGYVPSVRLFLLDVFDGTKVAVKIKDIYESITSDAVADSIYVRIVRYQVSLTSIVKYSVLGGLWFGEVGGHSALFDSFAKYGIWGGYMFIQMFYHVPLEIKRKTENHTSLRVANATFVSLILISLLNSVSYSFVFLIMIFLPILYNDIKKWGNIK